MTVWRLRYFCFIWRGRRLFKSIIFSFLDDSFIFNIKSKFRWSLLFLCSLLLGDLNGELFFIGFNLHFLIVKRNFIWIILWLLMCSFVVFCLETELFELNNVKFFIFLKFIVLWIFIIWFNSLIFVIFEWVFAVKLIKLLTSWLLLPHSILDFIILIVSWWCDCMLIKHKQGSLFSLSIFFLSWRRVSMRILIHDINSKGFFKFFHFFFNNNFLIKLQFIKNNLSFYFIKLYVINIVFFILIINKLTKFIFK